MTEAGPCADVRSGKTEVAMPPCQGGDTCKQPPSRSHTVLAQQHWAPPLDELFGPVTQSRWPC